MMMSMFGDEDDDPESEVKMWRNLILLNLIKKNDERNASARNAMERVEAESDVPMIAAEPANVSCAPRKQRRRRRKKKIKRRARRRTYKKRSKKRKPKKRRKRKR